MKKYWVIGFLSLLAGCGGGGGSSSSTHKPGVATATISVLAGTAAAAGYGDGTGSSARFNSPVGVALDSSGTVYVADQLNNTIRKITAAGVVTTLAGNPLLYGSSNGQGALALFNGPASVAVDAAGNVYVADSLNYTVRKISPAGLVSTLAGTAGITGAADGAGTAATFGVIVGITVDSAGNNIYVTDGGNNTIRQITAAGVVTTLAGQAGVHGSADGTGAGATFNGPAGIAVDGSGNLYVADFGNNTIRKIAPGGVVTTLAGQVGVSGFGDGVGTLATFNSPFGIALDGNGNLFVADAKNGTLRKVSTGNVVTTVAGYGGENDLVTGPAGTLWYPYGMAVDASGALYTTSENVVLKVVIN